ncbi:sensor histidine kinase [Amycolatopsis sp. H20-H5]|uniref:sensor histidine kinase n=1 Tax=Amycolatopsis sp. H20-H5 TaxID=3046309 RepID=UPI002DB60136|nr:HAMP domain-containing sensor histidine kinase [Amycolatopsis sp. H20-H5]MEC3979090.1 HAMP domain-containing sensor histidine kinase [Amycolatopsis sp. H20-H5]
MSSGRRLLLRSRVALATALVVVTAISGVSGIAWLVTEHNLRAELDQSLKAVPDFPLTTPLDQEAAGFHPLESLCGGSPERQPLQRFLEGIQLLRPDGGNCAPPGVDKVVTSPADNLVTTQTLRDGVTVSGVPVRVMVRPVGDHQALVFSRSLADITHALAGLRDALLLVTVLGVLFAALAGLLLTRRALAPIERLTASVEYIARTEDLSTTVEVTGRDEVGRLGRAFTAMTSALSDSRRRQRNLVADAAHELRTPLTSLRTNIDLLVRSEQTGRPLPAEHHTKIIGSLQHQAIEFGNLVQELVALATDERELLHIEVDMATAVDRALRRARTRAAEHEFDVDTEPWTLTGDPAALERVVLNLLDNAIKFSPTGSVIAVRSAPGVLTVADQGSGLAPEFRDQAFERFWRAPEARGMPGSGLGLAIVAGTVATYGGRVSFVDPAGGHGTCVRVELPTSP